MTKNIQRYLVGGIIVTSLFGCVSPQTQNAENRQVAQSAEVSEDQQLEVEFQTIIAAPNANELALTKMDKLFTLLLKANGFVDQFSRELDSHIAYKKQNPQAVVPEIAQSAPYKSLLKAWNLKERYSHEIEFLYSRALEVRTDLSTSNELKQKTRNLLKTVTTYAKTSQNLKRIEFQPLLASLGEIYKKHVVSYKAALRARGSPADLKAISAVSEIPEYGNLIFSTPAALNQYAKTVKEKSSAILSQPKFQKLSSEVDTDLNEIADPVSDRTPQALTQDLSCKDGKKICASVGDPGNMIGKIFPPGVWAFTYDDGPTPAYTTKIMDHFINYKDSQNPVGKATFFWTAKHFDSKAESAAELAANQEMIKKAIKHGFGISNHSYDHSDLNKASTNRTKQIITSNQIIETAVQKEDPSYKIQYFRCPYGSCYAPKIPAVRKMFVDQGQVHVYWRIDSLDWKFKDSAKASDLVIKQMELYDRGIILMHDVQSTTPETTRIVLNWMKNQNNNKGKNYKMVTIPEAVDLTNATK
jgi:peptidoglycan/xylan/chitin deacetylase (PgdA/CDA1 family)